MWCRIFLHKYWRSGGLVPNNSMQFNCRFAELIFLVPHALMFRKSYISLWLQPYGFFSCYIWPRNENHPDLPCIWISTAFTYDFGVSVIWDLGPDQICPSIKILLCYVGISLFLLWDFFSHSNFSSFTVHWTVLLILSEVISFYVWVGFFSVGFFFFCFFLILLCHDCVWFLQPRHRTGLPVGTG